MCLCLPWYTSIHYKLHKYLLRKLFLLPGYNCNYMNYTPADDLRNNFVDHGNQNREKYCQNVTQNEQNVTKKSDRKRSGILLPTPFCGTLKFPYPR